MTPNVASCGHQIIDQANTMIRSDRQTIVTLPSAVISRRNRDRRRQQEVRVVGCRNFYGPHADGTYYLAIQARPVVGDRNQMVANTERADFPAPLKKIRQRLWVVSFEALCNRIALHFC